MSEPSSQQTNINPMKQYINVHCVATQPSARWHRQGSRGPYSLLGLYLRPGTPSLAKAQINNSQFGSFNKENMALAHSIYELVQITSFYIESIIYLSYKTNFFNEEVNCTEPSLKLVFPAKTVKAVLIQYISTGKGFGRMGRSPR